MLVIGHAAAAGEAPENTLAGVEACLKAPADGIEIDLRLSADGVPVLMHDETAGRTTSLQGRVRELHSAELVAAGVPALGAVLDLVAGRLTVACELKATAGERGHDRDLTERVVHSIAAHNAEGWTAIHSFDSGIVACARALDPAIPAALIAALPFHGSLDHVMATALAAGAQAISLEHHAIDAELVRAAARRHLVVFAWTPDAPDEWERLAACGVTGIITNVPTMLGRMFRDPSHSLIKR